MILNDTAIDSLCRAGMVTPYDPELLNPASLDVRIGYTAVVETGADQFQEIDLSHYSKENPYWLAPKEFILVSTLEQFNIPSTLIGTFCLKSSRGREAWNNVIAGHIEPGWYNSVLTLELINEYRFTSIPMYPTLRIGQVKFEECYTPKHDYAKTGRYNNDLKVQRSRG